MNPYNLLRVGGAVPEIRLADPMANGKNIVSQAKKAEENGCALLVLPALSLTGVHCGDLFFQPHFYKKQVQALDYILNQTKSLNLTLFLGLYVKNGSRLSLASACVSQGKIWGFCPMNPSEEQGRWFSPWNLPVGKSIIWNKKEIPLSSSFSDGNLSFGSDKKNDLAIGQFTHPTHVDQPALWEGKALLQSHEERHACLMIYPSTTQSTDYSVMGGEIFIAQQGVLLSKKESFSQETALLIADLDVDAIHFQRTQPGEQDPYKAQKNENLIAIPPFSYVTKEPLYRNYSRTPFLPEKVELYNQAFAIQCHGLARRLAHVDSQKTILGVSGGLDSTLALLVCVKAHELLNRPRKDIIAITMPGLGTTGTTYDNALTLMKQLGVTLKEIPIKQAVLSHFKDIEQDPKLQDITYENAQARERTQILMDVANQTKGLVVGTGDLSEEALGWCTYNGDHMAMYNVNTGVPKTFIQKLIEFLATKEEYSSLRETLLDVVHTPISPELLPPDAAGAIAQKTEENIGPYRIHDFFLYHTLHSGMTPKKLLFIATHTFQNEYDQEQLKSWLKIFYRRFFTQQFKRNCAPDGPQVFSIGLSGHHGFVMPSDANYQTFLEELE